MGAAMLRGIAAATYKKDWKCIFAITKRSVYSSQDKCTLKERYSSSYRHISMFKTRAGMRSYDGETAVAKEHKEPLVPELTY